MNTAEIVDKAPLNVDPNDPNHWDLVKATQYGIVSRCKEIVEKEGVDVRKPDKDNITLLHWAAINNRHEVVDFYMSKGAIVDAIGGDLNATPLHWAVRQGHQSMVASLMRHGADPSIRDAEGSAALHIASQFSFWPIVAFLIAKGVDVDTYDTNGLTPLMWAVLRSKGPDTVRVLLGLGADPNLVDRKFRNLPLHFAIETPSPDSFELLLEITRDLQQHNGKGNSPISLASGKKEWMAEQIETELENRGITRTRGVRRIFSTKARRTGLLYAVSLFFLIAAGYVFDTNNVYLGPWASKFAAIICLYIFVFLAIKIAVPSSEVTLKMPICWSEATKTYITGVGLLVLWPVINVGWLSTLIYIICTPLLHYVFYKTVTADPGYIPTDRNVQYSSIIELAENEKLDSSTLCTSSLIKRPLRSKYCGTSKKLVARFDHYCPWVNNAVGFGNHKYFVMYLSLLIVNLSWHFYAISLYWSSEHGCNIDFSQRGSVLRAFACSGFVTWQFFHTCLHLIWVTLLLVTQLHFVLVQGVTTNERIRAHRYNYLTVRNSQIVHNAFNRGVLLNFLDFFEINLCGMKALYVDWRRKLELGPEFKAFAHKTGEENV